jgi:hypothetical protein
MTWRRPAGAAVPKDAAPVVPGSGSSALRLWSVGAGER